MFRVVTNDPKHMAFFMLCDNRHCSFAATAQVTADELSPEKYNKTQANFTEGAVREGWQVGLNAQICPDCTAAQQAALNKQQMAREQLEQDKRLVQIADPGMSAKANLEKLVGKAGK